jgi:hypothetical protein
LKIDVAVPTDNNTLNKERSRTLLLSDVAVPTDNSALNKRKKQIIFDN